MEKQVGLDLNPLENGVLRVGSEVETQKGSGQPAPFAAEPVCAEGSVTFSPDGDHPAINPNTPKAIRPWLFQKGKSGNPKGRPRRTETNGVKADRRRIFREIFEHRGEEVIRKAIDTALAGNEKLLIEVLKYITPQSKATSEMHDLGLPEDATASERLVAIQVAMTTGQISADTAAMMSKSIKDAVESEKILQAQQGIAELQQRLKTINGGGRV